MEMAVNLSASCVFIQAWRHSHHSSSLTKFFHHLHVSQWEQIHLWATEITISRDNTVEVPRVTMTVIDHNNQLILWKFLISTTLIREIKTHCSSIEFLFNSFAIYDK